MGVVIMQLHLIYKLVGARDLRPLYVLCHVLRTSIFKTYDHGSR